MHKYFERHFLQTNYRFKIIKNTFKSKVFFDYEN